MNGMTFWHGSRLPEWSNRNFDRMRKRPKPSAAWELYRRAEARVHIGMGVR